MMNLDKHRLSSPPHQPPVAGFARELQACCYTTPMLVIGGRGLGVNWRCPQRCATRCSRIFICLLVLLVLAAAIVWPRAANAQAASPANCGQAAEAQSAFHIERNKNRNRVVYGIHLNDLCMPTGKNPVYGRWLRLEDGPDVEKPLSWVQKLAYGTSKQTIEGNHVSFGLRAMPERRIEITTRLSQDGTCAVEPSIKIQGHRAHLDHVYVFASDGFLWPKVDYIDIFGQDSSCQPAHERIEP